MGTAFMNKWAQQKNELEIWQGSGGEGAILGAA